MTHNESSWLLLHPRKLLASKASQITNSTSKLRRKGVERLQIDFECSRRCQSWLRRRPSLKKDYGTPLSYLRCLKLRSNVLIRRFHHDQNECKDGLLSRTMFDEGTLRNSRHHKVLELPFAFYCLWKIHEGFAPPWIVSRSRHNLNSSLTRL